MSFAWPWVLLLLPLPWLSKLPSLYRRLCVGGSAGHRRLRESAGSRATSTDGPKGSAIRLPPDLAEALDELSDRRTSAPPAEQLLRTLAWSALLIALAQPSSPGDTVVQPVSGRAVAVVVDLSQSMERRDFLLDGEVHDRLSVVKRVVGNFVERRHGDRVALVLFGKQAFIASAPTFDLQALRSILDGTIVRMAGGSTAIGDALGLAIQALRDDPAGQKAIVLLSDGTNNAGTVEPEGAAELAAGLGIAVHTVALGSDVPTRGGLRTAVSADLDEATLAAISETSGGQFFRARTTAELESIYAAIDELDQADTPAPPIIIAHDWRWLPLAVALLSLLCLALLPRWRA